MKHAAFTIWELLAVLATIGVLALFLFPTICSSPGKARQIACQSNEKQIGLAIAEYAQDNDGSLPDIADAPGSRNTWRNAILTYTKSKWLYRCPSRRDNLDGPDGFFRSYAANYNGDYGGGKNDKGNGALADAGSKPVKNTDISTPNGLIMLCEVAGGNTPEFNIDSAARFGPDKKLLWAGHHPGSNYLLADGHMRYLNPQRTKDLWHRDASVPLSPNGRAVLEEAADRSR